MSNSPVSNKTLLPLRDFSLVATNVSVPKTISATPKNFLIVLMWRYLFRLLNVSYSSQRETYLLAVRPFS